MGLTNNSTGNKINEQDIFERAIGCDYTIAVAGNPNVGKSTIFNGLTGLHQHTGNWPGKTVANASGICVHKQKKFLLVDIPGTYSIMSNSTEEEIARDYICFGNPDCTVVVVDATCLERNLNLVYQTMEITKNIIVCVNLLDEAEKKGIKIDIQKLSEYLGVPVVGTIARKTRTLKKLVDNIYDVCTNKVKPAPNIVKYNSLIEEAIIKLEPIVCSLSNNQYLNRWICLKLLDGDSKILDSVEKNLNLNLRDNEDIKICLHDINKQLSDNKINKDNFRDKIVSSIIFKAEDICTDVCVYKDIQYNLRDRKIDKILTSKRFGIPIMILFLCLIFWLTIVGANYPSQILSNFFGMIQEKLLLFFEFIHSPKWLSDILVLGMFQTLSWVIAVMLPPMIGFKKNHKPRKVHETCTFQGMTFSFWNNRSNN